MYSYTLTLKFEVPVKMTSCNCYEVILVITTIINFIVTSQ